MALSSAAARADEGGVSFWLSGQVASLAATPPSPGWGLVIMPYNFSGSTSGAKTISRGGFSAEKTVSQVSLLITQLGYAPDALLFGAHPYVGMGFGGGRNSTQMNAALEIGGLQVAQRSLSDTMSGGIDLNPVANLFWSDGNNNWTVYLTGDIPSGKYNSQRIANLGSGHGALDAGGGYTYLNPDFGLEFSATAGLTYNLKNPDTGYRNGIDSHVDWGMSRIFSEKFQIGVVGYVYSQLTADHYVTDGLIGAARAKLLGDNKARVEAVGPQFGYVFKLGEQDASLNLRAYREFGAQNRVQGHTLFATFSVAMGR